MLSIQDKYSVYKNFSYAFSLSLLIAGPTTAEVIATRDTLLGPSHAARDLSPPSEQTIAQASAPPPAQPSRDETPTLDETLVEGELTRRRSTPVYTINEAEIRQKGAQNLADALRGLPGFAINDAGRGADFHNGSYYRGAAIGQNALLVNGRLVKTGLNSSHGATDLNSIPVEGIKRIELLGPGAGTTLYGSEVIGGVINVITEEGPKIPTLRSAIEYGSYGESNYRAGYGGTDGKTSYNLGYQSYGATNDFLVPFGSTNRDSLTGRLMNADLYTASYQGSFTYRFDDRNTLTFDALKTLSRKGLVIGDSKDRLNRDALNTGLTWRTELGEGKDSVLTTTLSYLDDYFSTYGPIRPTFFKSTDLSSKFYMARVDHTWRTSPGNTLQWGVDVKHNTFTSDTKNSSPNPTFANLSQFTDASITNVGLFALDTWRIVSGVQLDFGLRQTFDSKFGNYLNPSIGARWDIVPEVALRASFATVQRNPGPDVLFAPDAAEGFLPNPDLKAERGTTYNVGFDFQPSRSWSAQVTYFGSLISDRIGNEALNDGSGQSRRANIGAVGTNGVEVGLRWQVSPQWSTFLNYTYTKVKIEPGRFLGTLRFLPESVALLGIGYQNEGLEVNTFVNFNSGAARTNDLGSYTPGYTTVDLRAAIPLNRALALTVYLANLADTQYERVNTFYTPGITYRLGLQAGF